MVYFYDRGQFRPWSNSEGQQSMSNDKISIAQLTSIESATGKIAEVDGKTTGILSIQTGAGEIEMTLDEWDALYRGTVKVWPGLSPLKAKVVAARRNETKLAKEQERKAEADRKAGEKAAAKKTRADKLAAAKDAKVDKEKAAAEAKKKADTAKAAKAASAKK